ncbi:G3P dehydrogenase, partial [Crocuta crocuta]
AAKVVGKIIPELTEKFTSMAFCVPIPDVLVINLTYCMEKAAKNEDTQKNGEVGVRMPFENENVSCYFNNDIYSLTFDAEAGTPLMIILSNSLPDIIINLILETR